MDGMIERRVRRGGGATNGTTGYTYLRSGFSSDEENFSRKTYLGFRTVLNPRRDVRRGP